MNVENNQPLEDRAGGFADSLHLLWIAWHHRSLVFLGTVVGLVLAGIYYAQIPPSYQTTAQLLVIKNQNQPDTMQTPGLESRLAIGEDYLATHLTLLKSAVIVSETLKKPEVRALPSLGNQPEPLDALTRSLTVSRDAKDALGGYNNILNLTHRGSREPDGQVVLNAHIDSYKHFLDDAYRRSNDDTLELVAKARDSLEKELVKKHENYKEFRRKAPLLPAKGKAQGSMVHERMATVVDARRSAVLLRMAAIQGHLKALEQKLAAGASNASLIAMVSDFSRSSLANANIPSVSPAPDQLPTLLVLEQEFLQKFGPDHPQVQAIRKRIQVASNPLAVSSEVRGTSDRQDKELVKDRVRAHMGQLKDELEYLGLEEESLGQLAKRFELEARDLSNYEVEDEVLRDDFERSRKFYDTIIKRLQEVNLVKEFRGYDARVISPPRTKPVMPNLILILFAGALLGTLGGCGLAYLAYTSERSFRTPEEIRRRLGLALIGHVPQLKEADEPSGEAVEGQPVLAPSLCAFHQPRSRDAETFRSIRTALFFAVRESGHKVIQITSPNQGDGKSTIAANLAISAAQAGKRVLLIDADFRRPRVGQLFGITAATGLASVIVEGTDPQEAIQSTPVADLQILPCGPIPTNPAELLNAPRFKEALTVLREKYDFVLIDTPPLLAVSDPCVVAAAVDGVILAIRIRKNCRPAAERAKDILDTLGRPILGVVVNGTGDEQGFRYGYGYGYGYGYHYGYEQPYQQDAAAGDALPPNGEPAPPPQKKPRHRTTILGRIFKR